MKKKVVLLVMLVVFLFCLLFYAPTLEKNVKIYGYIKRENGTAKADIEIKDLQHNTLVLIKSDEKGYYETLVSTPKSKKSIFYKGLEVLNGYYISVSSEGYMPAWKIISLGKEKEISINFTLEPAGVIILKAYRDGSVLHELDYPYYTTDLNWKAIRSEVGHKNNIPAFFVLPTSQVLNLLWEVPGFGKIILRADNGGKGYLVEQGDNITINLNYELAKTQYRILNDNYKEYVRESYLVPNNIIFMKALAKKYLDKASLQTVEKKALFSDYSLNSSLWALEKLELEKAKQDIERYRKVDVNIKLLDKDGDPIKANITYNQTEHDFLFGALLHNEFPHDDKIISLLKDAGFNYLITKLYWHQTEPKKEKFNLDDEKYLEYLSNLGFKLGAEGLIVLEPGLDSIDLIGLESYELKKRIYEHVNKIASTYSEIDNWVVSHEAAYQKHALGFSREQNIEFIREGIKAVRDVDNFTSLVYEGYPGGYFAGTEYQGNDDDYTVEPYTFYQILKEKGINFEPALSFNYGSCLVRAESEDGRPVRDLSSLSKILDWYGNLNKTLYITELHFLSNDANCRMGYWHRPADERLQAEWLKGFYTIAFSKPFVEEITYWGVKDFPEAEAKTGIMDKDGKTKPAYYMIKKLIKEEWSSHGKVESDEKGVVSFRGFLGKYNTTISVKGKILTKTIYLSRTGNNIFEFNI